MEDPAYDAMDGYSDWDYYSDDYYDDDPTLLKDKQQLGCPVQRSKVKKPNGPQRGKKRKLLATSDVPNLSLDQGPNDKLIAMKPWFKGTVWRSSSPDEKEKELYQPGMGDRVALLADWREVFRSSRPHNKNSKKYPVNSSISDHTTTETTIASPRTEPRTSINGRINGATEGVEQDEDDIAGLRSRKRRRISFAKDLQGSSCDKVVVEIPLRRVSDTGENKALTQNKIEQKHSSRRKRKASEAEDEKLGVEQVTARAKRIAARPPRKMQNKEKATLPTARTTRSKTK